MQTHLGQDPWAETQRKSFGLDILHRRLIFRPFLSPGPGSLRSKRKTQDEDFDSTNYPQNKPFDRHANHTATATHTFRNILHVIVSHFDAKAIRIYSVSRNSTGRQHSLLWRIRIEQSDGPFGLLPRFMSGGDGGLKKR
jgi:hypothetical protein